ncbi:flagellar basal body rod protein FlgC [Buchnera aphidicola]|uniref:flagellar basal body rod protein FlgC n=1 Tax=Buchnera aphidicola TaxID=9 RepID=UPI0031B80A88
MSLFGILDIVGSAMDAQIKKMLTFSSNIANAEKFINKNGQFSPYVSKKVILKPDTKFGKYTNGVKVDKIINNPSPFKVVYNPDSPLANSKGYAPTSNVNIISEMIHNISTSHDYQADAAIINTIKYMILKTLSVGS